MQNIEFLWKTQRAASDCNRASACSFFVRPSASRAVVVEGDTQMLEYCGLDKVLNRPNTDMRIFSKPCVTGGHRRMAVLLARGESIEEADKTTADMLADFEIKTF